MRRQEYLAVHPPPVPAKTPPYLPFIKLCDSMQTIQHSLLGLPCRDTFFNDYLHDATVRKRRSLL